MNDTAANLAIFLTERRKSCLLVWKGKMLAKEQRALFGRFLGKGTIWIDGGNETVEHWRKDCFGLDATCTASIQWKDL